MSLLVKVNALWRVPLIFLWTAAMATLSLALSLIDGTGRLQHWCAKTWSQWILFVSRVEVEIRGLEHLEPGRGYLFASNHLSMFDHWAFLACLPVQIRFAAKSSLFRWPFLGWHLRRSGHISVERNKPRQTLRAFGQASEMINSGICFIIYPEGGRTWGEGVAPFKRGSLLLARYAGAPIVPVTIIGAHRRLPRGSVFISPGIIQMIIHPPLDFTDYKDLDLKEVTASVRRIIAGSYRQVSS